MKLPWIIVWGARWYQRWASRLIGILFLLCLLGNCGHPTPRPGTMPPLGFQATDLLGVWHTVVGVYPVDETLFLFPDGTYVHQYMDITTQQMEEDRGTWWVDTAPAPCVYVYLMGMRYIHDSHAVAQADNRDILGAPIRPQEPCRETTFAMADKVILTVGSLPNYTNNLSLFFPRMSVDESYETMEQVSTLLPESAHSVKKESATTVP